MLASDAALRQPTLRTLLLAAPVIFIAHFIEEGPAFVAWFSLLMFANALFHVAGALVDRAYMPGLVTALLLYLPFYAWLVVRVIRLHRLQRGTVFAAASIGALPMLVHGYLIVFRGSRLF